MAESIGAGVLAGATEALVRKHGEGERGRAGRGVASAAALWRAEDGDTKAFADFCAEHFVPTGPCLDALFARLEANFEELYGSGRRIAMRAEWAIHVDTGDLLPVDELFAAWNPLAHLSDDFFANKIAFAVRLNFPARSLDEKLAQGPSWSRREWAMARLGEAFATRVPADVELALSAAYSQAESYIAKYNIHTECLRDAEGPLYSEAKSLLMHWNLRDEIKSQYGLAGGLRRQRVLYTVMERHVDGSIPKAVIDATGISWDPLANKVEAEGRPVDAAPEGHRRYGIMAAIRDAELRHDAFSPEAPTLLARRFGVERELSVETVEALLESLFVGDTYRRAAARVSTLLGRPLEAFDVWFRDFGGEERPDEAALDSLTRPRYPDAEAFGKAIPEFLLSLGFTPEDARWLAARIAVDPARGSGHAAPAAMRSDKVRLRTRVGVAGMDYKGYNIATHELGHNVEQVYSLHGIDEYFLSGVPNTAFTEAFAFVFQARDLEVLLGGKEGRAATRKSALTGYWAACEIAGVSLVDIGVWRWLYAHPGADAEALRGAVLDIARSVWNRLFAPAFGLKDALVLGVYSHMIEFGLYLPDYPLGHLVAFQIEDYLKDKVLGREMGRMCRLGRLTPNEWMMKAVGSRLSSEALVAAARKELADLA